MDESSKRRMSQQTRNHAMFRASRVVRRCDDTELTLPWPARNHSVALGSDYSIGAGDQSHQAICGCALPHIDQLHRDQNGLHPLNRSAETPLLQDRDAGGTVVRSIDEPCH